MSEQSKQNTDMMVIKDASGTVVHETIRACAEHHIKVFPDHTIEPKPKQEGQRGG